MQAGKPIEEHIPEDPGEPEKVLVLQPAGAAPLIDLHGQPVPLLPDPGRHIEFRRRKAVLTVAHKFPVEPHIQGGFHPLKGQDHPFPPECLLQIKLPHIAGHRVILPVDRRGTQLRMAVPGIHSVHIMALVIPIPLDMPRHPDLSKIRIVKSFLVKIRLPPGRIFPIGNLPDAVQALAKVHPSPRRLSCFHGGISLIKPVIRMGRKPVHGKYLRVLQPCQIGNPAVHKILLYFNAPLKNRYSLTAPAATPARMYFWKNT